MNNKIFITVYVLVIFCFICFELKSEELKSQQYRLETITLQKETLAVVNGQQIKTQDLINRLMSQYGSQVLSVMIDEILLQQAIDTKKTSISLKEMEKEKEKRLKTIKSQFNNEDEFNKKLIESNITLEALKKQIEQQILKEKLVEDKIKLTDDEIKQFFQQNKEKLITPETVRLKHILVSTQQEANDLIVAINSGADFDKLVLAKSIDSATKNKHGDLGYFSKGQLSPQIEDVVFKLKLGEITSPVKTDYGYSIIKVTEKIPEKQAVLDKNMKEKISETLKQQKLNTALNELLDNLRKNAKIEIIK